MPGLPASQMGQRQLFDGPADSGFRVLEPSMNRITSGHQMATGYTSNHAAYGEQRAAWQTKSYAGSGELVLLSVRVVREIAGGKYMLVGVSELNYD